ncbi:MAG: transcription-repair coupling factor [Culicoidibacterales bacterium]
MFTSHIEKLVAGMNKSGEAILSFGQTTAYLEIELARFFIKKANIVVSVYPTLYLAMSAYESVADIENTVFFGADEFVSAQLLSASPELLLQRIGALQQIEAKRRNGCKIWVITHIAGITRPIMPREIFLSSSLKLAIGDQIKRDQMLLQLIEIGYTRVALVEKTGEFAIRGDVIDLFSPMYDNPVRFSFFDDEIELCFLFNAQTQLTIEKMDAATILPMVDQLGEDQVSLIDYLPQFYLIEHQKERLISTYHHMCRDAEQFSSKADKRATSLYIEYESIPPKAKKQIICQALEGEISLRGITISPEKRNSVKVLQAEVTNYLMQGYQLMLLIGDMEQKEAIKNVSGIISDMTNVFCLADRNYNEIIETMQIIVIDYFDFTGQKNQKEQASTIFKHIDVESKIQQLDEISQGDFIVHTKHGIGRYDGVQKITAQEIQKDFIVLSYQGDEKIYLPVEKIDTLYKYVAGKEGFEPKLSKIGDKTWKKRTDKVSEHVEAFAQELFTLYMEREQLTGFSFAKDTENQKIFEARFPYAETADQTLAIAEIKADMEKPFIMERILCGDVGFGKTEVAFRAAFKAMENGKQVVLLAPTTILVKQHYENALKRFAGFGYNIAMLSRLVSKKSQNESLFNIELGEVQLVIGTHRVLSDDIVYDNLGLVMIDEEHRFGVSAKEKLKRFKTEVDVLLISATPIPRTLQMAITGIREMSLLQTPPHNRYPVQTYVIEQNEYLVRDAIERELARNGQTYYLYNKVQTIETMTSKLQKMLPNVTIAYAHGQMPKNKLEDIINKFVDKQIDVLVSTTIIENGMDIPNANTLIIHDADMLGLAQLYQLRGRVGRSQKIAYSYFMYHPARILTQEATKRLQTVQSFTEFGSGYHIAMRDLAIRGAGDVLGKTQSGFINDVGFDLYVDMLQGAIAQQKNPELRIDMEKNNEIEVNLNIPSYIPSTYIYDESIKIEIYQLLNKIVNIETMAETRGILTNRFGKLPEEVEYLLYVFLLKAIGKSMHVQYVRQLKNKVTIQFVRKLTDKLNKIGIQQDFRQKEYSIETKYALGVLQLSITTMRKNPIEWLYEVYQVIGIVNNNIK